MNEQTSQPDHLETVDVERPNGGSTADAGAFVNPSSNTGASMSDLTLTEAGAEAIKGGLGLDSRPGSGVFK